MSDLTEPAVEAERNDGDGKNGDGSRPARVRTESEGYGITEEQEKTLLAGEEDDNLDLDVIECFVDDFDSDMEEEFRRKDAKKVELPEKKANDGTGKADEVKRGDTVEVLEVVRIVHNADESGSTTEEPLEGFEEEAPAPDVVEEADDDEDVIQIVEESVEDLLGDGKVEETLEASVHVSDETENERILSKPLVKQVVMDMSGKECVKKDEPTGQVGDERSHKGDEDDRVEAPNLSQDDSDAEQPLVIADSVEANVGAMSGRHQEDPDVLQLKLDLQQNLGKMDYEPDDEDRRERLERRIQIKEEPMSPVRDRLERILLDVEDIPTIVLSSDDDLAEQVVQEKKPKKAKKKSKKKSKQRSKSECSVIEAAPIDVEESLAAVNSATSSKSLHSNDCMFMDEELFKTGFRMELRKRKSATRLEESVTSPPSRKRRNPTRKSSDCRSSIGQSKSRGSIASTVSSNMSEYNVPADNPPKKTPSQKSTSRHVSTAHKPKINSLFDDSDNPEVVPVSITVDGMPLFEKVPKKHVTAPVPPPHRQTMLIDALPQVGVASPIVKPGPSKSSGLKSKIEQEIMHSLENDLAMSSDDEVALQPKKLGSVKGRSPAPSEKSGRKRGRAPKHHIEDYFGSSPTHDKKDETPATETASNGGGKKPQIKRRKKRSRISSGSSEYETTATESTSLAGTISTITAREGDEEQLPVAPEEVAPPKTDEMRVVLSPLTDAKIEKLSKCNTPKKQRALSKASQTELQGLSWRIDLDQIDFHSEYFEKLYQLIVNGRELRNNLRTSNNNNNKFEGVVLVGRDAVLPPTPPERSPQRPVGNGRARSVIEQLLFQRADEIEFESSAPVDPAARERMERSVRSNFRIPKIAKQPSRSPQDVTSSTQHDNEQQHYQENETRRSSSGGYSNDRHVVAPDARRPVTVGSPLRNPNRPEAAAPTIDPQPAARPVPIMRRTIRNDNVQPPPQPTVAPPTPAQPQPVENGFSTYGPPEQVPAPQQQYRASASNMFQPPQQQQQQLGGYTASGQEMDVKPNISALMNPANMLGTAMMNPSRFFDSLSMVYQVTMMQMMQQHMPFPAMNPAGQAPFPGPSVAPTAANMAQQPQPMPAQMMPPPQPTPSSSAGPRFAPDPVQSDEVSDQICQIFGCIDHLKGRCIKNPCQYSHTLPNESSLLQMLLGSAQDVVMTTYQFIVGQDSLFLRYFPVYTEVMGRRNMRHQLVDAVPHCEQSKRAFSHYRYIVDGLTINGTLTRSKAVQLVLEKHRKINFDQINVLITLMLDTGDDIPQFLQWFEQFAQVQDYHYEIPSINRLIKFCVRCSRSVDVAKLTYRLVLSVAPGKEPFVDTDALSEFVEQLMKSKLGLDLEKIRLKYRENELSCSARR
ncbi:actin cytoskeleton-regulatory complex protein PAN1 isoform X2 [Culex quinquefasciatus]|uniref:actin cytoskeleton-regulatory complex protein PAN1 isoform X2 n=1 Tax=Culex quinquefasciatus TaxID=7176 RepID=UPI0018E35427|nr:actin cytoskeleton-regulatory complex protein PAN1 isoform X2 [Culex quinquefasciatus]XP_038118451.1 actin cytoskeleton-regulatory complex protein PAN1 isoform X2 [Culex quinquefasciatus]XP_038118452.1 actin cytoskeleton-regulatory complex protein PAN1 isoform X2 [Culex quinquefasciatus]